MRASVVIEFLTKGLDKAKAGERSLRDLGRAADGAGSEASDLARAENRVADAGNRMAAGQTRAASSLQRQTDAMRRQKAEAVALATQQERLFRKQQKQSTTSVAGATAGLAGMRGVGAAFIGGLGLGVGGAAGAGLIAKETLELSARIEYERDQLQVLGEYSDEKAKLYDKILKPAGARRGVGTMGAYGVFGELMAGGLSAENSTAMTDSVLTFAKATRAETTDAGKTAVALQNNMKVGAGQMMDAFDAMALAGKEGQFEVRDMARNAPSIFAKMAKLGETGLQGVHGFAAMAQEIRGTAGTSDEAATNFENMLDKMTSGDFVKNAKKMGIDVQKVFADANKRGVSPVLEMLKKIKAVTGGDAFKLKELMPDVQANSALSALIAKIPELEAAIGRYGNAGGTVMRDFATATDNATEAWNRFSSNIKNKAEQIGGKSLPFITDAMNNVSTALEGQEARAAGVESISGGDSAVEGNVRDEFFKRYKTAFQKDGDKSDLWILRASKAWEDALQRKGHGEISTVFEPVEKLEGDQRRKKAYSQRYVPGRGPENPLEARPATGAIPTPERRPDPKATRLATAYGHGTGREQIRQADQHGEQPLRDRISNAIGERQNVAFARVVEEDRTRDAYAEYGRSRMEATGQAPSWLKEFLFGKAAWPDFDARDHFGIETRHPRLEKKDASEPSHRRERDSWPVSKQEHGVALDANARSKNPLDASPATGDIPLPKRRPLKENLFKDAPDNVMGYAAKPTAKATKGQGIYDDLARSKPVGGGDAGEGFAKGVEEGGKKAERAMETSARAVEQIADSVDTYAAGLKAGSQYAAGLAASAAAVADAANKALVQPVANRVPQSPAKIGPLRKLPLMGRKIAQQLAGGIDGDDAPARAADTMAKKIGLAADRKARPVKLPVDDYAERSKQPVQRLEPKSIEARPEKRWLPSAEPEQKPVRAVQEVAFKLPIDDYAERSKRPLERLEPKIVEARSEKRWSASAEPEQKPVRAAQDVALKIASTSSEQRGREDQAQKPVAAVRQAPSVTIGQIVLNGIKDAADGVNNIGVELERRLAGVLADV